jgi:methylated-DNA-[protein]-cysteine S-methyltransferase
MLFISHYRSPLGGMTLASDGNALVGLWFDGQKYFGSVLHEETTERPLPVFDAARRWLDVYFSGEKPDFLPPIAFSGSDFRCRVWRALLKVNYGETVTYGELARRVADEMGQKSMSAQAVGGAVGHNPIAIIVPCHRVIGKNGSLTGYAGGIERKLALLKTEGADTGKLKVPANGTEL